MSVSGVSGGGGFQPHPFVDPREMDLPKPDVGANAGTAFARLPASSGNAFVSPTAVPPPRDLGRLLDKKL